jgi:hypothetical protein
MSKDVIWEIQKLGLRATDPNLTGWVNWPAKQELYKIYWAVKKELNRCSTFTDEDEWLKEHDEEVFLEKLEGKS